VAYHEIVPHPALRPFVDRLWLRVAGGESAAAFRVLPDGCLDVLVVLGLGVWAVGAMTRPLVVEPRRVQTTVAVRFRPGRAAPFLGVDAHALTDRRVPGSELGLTWPGLAAVADARDAWAAARLLERSLLAQLARLPAPAPAQRLVAMAVYALYAPAPVPITHLAEGLRCTRQHLGRAFRTLVGVGPKQLARVARVQRALARLQDAADTSLAAIAAEAGYFDEAHMDRDFRALVGVRPGAARADAGSIRPMRSLLDEAGSAS
jgi:AraC-like DNA-binding protein